MSQSFIQNYGSTKTFINDNGKKQLNNIKWNVKYDGNKVRGEVNVKSDRSKKKFKIDLDNNDLASLLNIKPVHMSLDKRLANDFSFSNNNESPQYQQVIIPLSRPYNQDLLMNDENDDPMTQYLTNLTTDNDYIEPIYLTHKRTRRNYPNSRNYHIKRSHRRQRNHHNTVKKRKSHKRQNSSLLPLTSINK
jgi:hypothetical protein